MTNDPNFPAAPSRLSKSSLFSLICGILLCIPFFTGALAIILGIIGFFRAGKPGVRGRWMAVVGGILGLVNVVAFGLFFGALLALFLSLMGAAKEPQQATQAFVQQVAASDYKTVQANNPDWNEADLKKLHDDFAAAGTYSGISYNGIAFENSNWHFTGDLKFSNGTLHFTADLDKESGAWHVKAFHEEK